MCEHGDSSGPYKWLVLLACFGIQLTGSGIVYCVGVFYVIFAENIGGSSTSLSLAGSLNMGFFFAMGPVSGVLSEKYGCRPVAVVGALLGTTGLVVTIFSTQAWHLHLSFGLMTGLGLGLTYVPSIAAIPQYFIQNRPLVFGIVAGGLGTGPIVFSPLIQFFLHEFGWRGAILMTAGLYSHTIIFASLLRPNYVTNIEPKFKDSDKSDKNGKVYSYLRESIDNIKMFTDIRFASFMFHFILFSFGSSIIFVHVGAYAITKGISEDRASMLFFIIGITSATLRPVTGLVAQTKCLSACKLHFIALNLCSVATILFPFATNYVMFCIGAAFIGSFYASYGALPPLVTVEIVGVEKIALAYGYVCVFCGIGFALGGPFAGWLYDTTMYYPGCFFCAGGIMAVSTLFLIPVESNKCQPAHSQPDDEGAEKT